MKRIKTNRGIKASSYIFSKSLDVITKINKLYDILEHKSYLFYIDSTVVIDMCGDYTYGRHTPEEDLKQELFFELYKINKEEFKDIKNTIEMMRELKK